MGGNGLRVSPLAICRCLIRPGYPWGGQRIRGRARAASAARRRPRRDGSGRRRVRAVLRGVEAAAADDLDPVAVRIGDERDQRQPVAAARVVGRPLGLHAELREVRERGLDVLDGDRDVVVAVAEAVGLVAPDVDRQLQPVPVARQPHVDVVGRLEVEPPALLEAERAVEADGGVDVADADARVHEGGGHGHTLPSRPPRRRPRPSIGSAPPGARPRSGHPIAWAAAMAETAPGAEGLRPQALTVHGHRVSYRTAGSGPVLLLLHGVTDSSQTWAAVTPRLAERFTLVAPDLLGHGDSARPRGDYSLGAHANGVRDLLTALGHRRVTVVGHSLGGGIAMQFAYQFPERCERLVLVSSGGLGREVHMLLRAAGLPGADWVLPWLTSPWLHGVGRTVGGLLRRGHVSSPGDDQEVLARGFASLGSAGARHASLQTLRPVVEPAGQRVGAGDRLGLAVMPTLIVWGERDSIIPVSHGIAAHEAIPASELVIFPDAGHMPHHHDPRRFADTLRTFCESTEAARLTTDHWRPRLDDDDPA